MQITFKNIIPAPLQDQAQNSEIWGKEIHFSPNTNYSILAPSGKGKSTFVHTLYGLRKDHQGQLLWGDQSFEHLDWEAIQRIRREVFGIIFQDLRLFPKLTPWENIQLYHEGKTIDHAAIQDMAQILGIQSLLEQQTALLSYGQMQRVAILRTLSRPFQWLIMDEPFSHLDEENKDQAMALINEVAQGQNATMVLMGLDEIPKGYAATTVYKL